jgi:hypothetical protein
VVWEAGEGGQYVVRYNGLRNGSVVGNSKIINLNVPRTIKDLTVDTGGAEPDNMSIHN